MRTARATLSLALATLFSPIAVQARQFESDYRYGLCSASAQCIYGINAGHKRTLLSIRKAALEQQREDGGTLTSVHLANFQNQLDAANRIYLHKLEVEGGVDVRSLEQTPIGRN